MADYLRRFRQVLARCGTSPDPQSLGDLFWKNLKPAIREKCRIDPQTGKFWTSFEAMAEHTVLFDSQNYEPSTTNPSRFRGSKAASIKAVAAAAPPPKQDNRRSSGGGGGSNRGERAGGKGGGDRSDPKKRARTDRPHPGCDGLKNGRCNANWVVNHYENHTPGCDYAPGGSRHKPYQGGGGSRGPR